MKYNPKLFKHLLFTLHLCVLWIGVVAIYKHTEHPIGQLVGVYTLVVFGALLIIGVLYALHFVYWWLFMSHRYTYTQYRKRSLL
ncbi:hypothetical protein Presley_8 [Acinetobacter phage Presley]|uniref:Uncharacterized protein n=1 Tax=Acinetobacter phage Presley TaxID=1406780 RepID=U5PVQ9_9CAUD|nr:hypothetical protein Presley_8 [Acinetobacter phage Presley]AGY48075.1 hypothetical protein Presley_8 [Acinetobacter phage Presley]